MDFEKIVQNREIRKSRHARPFINFVENTNQCIDAGREIIEGKETSNHISLLERSVIISFATHVEVYFRDMLDLIFRNCDPEYFFPKLRYIHQSKYSIEDLLEIYERQIHPLEIVSGDMSFQNAEKIEKVFSKFLGKSLWKQAINIQVRIKDKPETAVKFESEYLDGLKRIFSLRHELVHNPKMSSYLTSDILKDIENSRGLIFAVDIILSHMLVEKKDPNLCDESEIDE